MIGVRKEEKERRSNSARHKGDSKKEMGEVRGGKKGRSSEHQQEKLKKGRALIEKMRKGAGGKKSRAGKRKGGERGKKFSC